MRPTENWQLYHGNATAYSSNLIKTFWAKHKISVLCQAPFSPDMVSCDFYLFTKVKKTTNRDPIWVTSGHYAKRDGPTIIHSQWILPAMRPTMEGMLWDVWTISRRVLSWLVSVLQVSNLIFWTTRYDSFEQPPHTFTLSLTYSHT